MIAKAEKFLREDIWRIDTTDFPTIKAFLYRMLKVLLIALRGFSEDKVSLRASALTFYSMLSVVPVIAMAFGISKGFGLDSKLKEEIMNSMPGQEAIADYLIQFAESFLENTKGYLIAGVGLILLFWTVLKVLGNIESSFNAIWQIKKPRTWFRKFSDYLSMMLIAPVMMISSSSTTVYISTKLADLQQYDMIDAVSPILFFLVNLIPYVLIWFLLTIIYMVMPNTKVNFRSAFIAGIIAGTVFTFTQWVYVHFQVGVSKFNAIYGSFAAIPLFLVWLQTSWLIILFGTEISFGDQNLEKYEYEPDVLNLNQHNKKIISILITNLLVKNFEKSMPPSTAPEISKKLEIPIRLVREIIYDLEVCNIITETKTEFEKERAYQPAFDISKMTISHLIEALEIKGLDKIIAVKSEARDKISDMLDRFYELIKKDQGSTLVKDI